MKPHASKRQNVVCKRAIVQQEQKYRIEKNMLNNKDRNTMRKIISILSLLLTFPIVALYGQSENEQDISDEVIEIELNNQYYIRLKQISESEYTAQKAGTEHLRHKSYKVITDVVEAQKVLGKSVKSLEVYDEEQNLRYPAIEITFKSRVKKRFDWRSLDEYGFIAYYPELKVLVLNHEADGEHPIDFNDNTNEQVGNPRYHVLSPDKQLRIAGYFPGGAWDGVRYFLEKWNTKENKYEFVSYLENEENYVFTFLFASDWFWTSNSKVFFRVITHMGAYYEMEIFVQ